MLTLRILRKKCNAVTEIEFFLFIYEMGQAISIVAHELEHRAVLIEGVTPQEVTNDLAKAGRENESAIKKLTQFGLTNSVSDFLDWYRWWLKYLYSLNDVELVDLEKSRLNGEDLSEWYPEGHW